MVAGVRAGQGGREVIDYGDQVAIAARIAARHPEVGAAERGRYQVVLLDEYQDTSHAQLVLLRALFGGWPPGDRGRRPMPVDLRVARRERGQPAPVRPGLPGGHGQRPGPGIQPGRGAHAVDQLPQHRPGPRRGRGDAAGAARRGARRAPAGAAAGPGRPRPGDLRAASRRPPTRRPGSPDRSARCWPCRRRGAGRPAVAGRPRGRVAVRETSRCCAASALSSPRCAALWRPAASRLRSSASAGC